MTMTVEMSWIQKITISFSICPTIWTSEENNRHFWKSICSTSPSPKRTWFSEELSWFSCLKFRPSALSLIWTQIPIVDVTKFLQKFQLFRTRWHWREVHLKSCRNARTNDQKSLWNFKKNVETKKDFQSCPFMANGHNRYKKTIINSQQAKFNEISKIPFYKFNIIWQGKTI